MQMLIKKLVLTSFAKLSKEPNIYPSHLILMHRLLFVRILTSDTLHLQSRVHIEVEVHLEADLHHKGMITLRNKKGTAREIWEEMALHLPLFEFTASHLPEEFIHSRSLPQEEIIHNRRHLQDELIQSHR